MSKAPCRGSSNCLLFFYSCPYRALAVCVRLPRAMPWAMETLGFQPVFAQTLLFTSLRKRYWSRSCANVIGHVLAQTLLFSRPCANVVGIASLQFYVVASSQLLIFPSLFHSFSFLLNCFFVPIFVMPFVRDAFGMIVDLMTCIYASM